MGNKSSKTFFDISSIKKSVSSKMSIVKKSVSWTIVDGTDKKMKVKPCKCLIYEQNGHCCLQECLPADYYQHLSKVWLFTECHAFQVMQVLNKMELQDMIFIIGAFLDGINSTLEEYNIFCHGPVDSIGIPCYLWLKTRRRQIQMEILGAKGVGKSALALKCAKNMYPIHSDDNIQSVYVKKVLFENNIALKLRIFDGSLSGFAAFQSQQELHSNINGYDGINFIYVLCVDPSSDAHFEAFGEIKDSHYNLTQTSDPLNLAHDAVTTAFIVVATKCDLKSQKYIRRSEMIIIYCKEQNIPYIEVSAKKGINMDQLLKRCVYELWIQTQTHCSQ